LVETNARFQVPCALSAARGKDVGVVVAKAAKGVQLKLHKANLQEIADLTQQATDLYDDNGIVRMVLNGWPCGGNYLYTATPRTEPAEA